MNEELKDLFNNLDEKDKRRLVFRYVLCLKVMEIARWERVSYELIYQSIRRAVKTQKKLKDHETWMELLSRIFNKS